MTNLARSSKLSPLLSELADYAFRSPLSSSGGPDWNDPRAHLNARVIPEDDKNIIEVEVPGVEPSEVKVRVEGRSLSVDTPRGSAYFTIGQRIDGEGAEAELRNGLLKITVPKREAKVVHVKVTSEG